MKLTTLIVICLHAALFSQGQQENSLYVEFGGNGLIYSTQLLQAASFLVWPYWYILIGIGFLAGLVEGYITKVDFPSKGSGDVLGVVTLISPLMVIIIGYAIDKSFLSIVAMIYCAVIIIPITGLISFKMGALAGQLRLFKDKEKAFQFYLGMYNSNGNGDEEWVRYSKIIQLFDKLGDKRAIPVLLKDTDNFELRKEALVKLGASNDQLFDFYQRGLKKGKRDAISYFVELKDPRGISALLEYTEDFGLRKEALVKLGATNDQLINFYARELETSRYREAIGYLVELGDKRAVPILRQYSGDLEKKLGSTAAYIPQARVIGYHKELMGWTFGKDLREEDVPDYEYYDVSNPEYAKLQSEIWQVSNAIAALTKGPVR